MLSKEKLKKFMDSGLSDGKIALKLKKSKSFIRKKRLSYNLPTSFKQYNKNIIIRKCKECGDNHSDNFYKVDKTRCKICYARYRKESKRLTKLKAVKYKGSCCSICKFDKYSCSLEFHHLDPNTKLYSISSIISYKWEIIQKELDKCIMVCSNCHRAIHAGHIDIKKYINLFKNK